MLSKINKILLLLILPVFICGFSLKILIPSSKSGGGKMVKTEADARACYNDAKKFNETLGIVINEDIPMKCVSRDELLKEYSKSSGGYEGDVFAFYKTIPETIFLPLGYSYHLVMPACAHELSHAWQTRNCPQYQNIILKEAFASWVQSKAYASVGKRDLAAKRMRSNVAKEQKMLDYIANLEKQGGPAAVLDYCKKRSSLPKEVSD